MKNNMLISSRDYSTFTRKVKSKLKEKEWTYADLALATGYQLTTILAFLSKTGRKSEMVANSISTALQIER